MSAPTAVRDHLAGVGALSLTAGVSVFAGEVIPPAPAVGSSSGVKARAVFCRMITNPPPHVLMGGGDDILISNVQVIIRGDREQFAATETLAIDVRNELHKANITGFFSVLVRESQPNDLGRDESDHPLWGMNLEMFHQG